MNFPIVAEVAAVRMQSTVDFGNPGLMRHPSWPRRVVRFTSVAMTCLALAPAVVVAQAVDAPRMHAIAKIGEPAMPADFKHFDWVNPQAPKGGAIIGSTVGNFDNLNAATFKGLAAPALYLIDATLMTPSLDEPAVAYGLIAEWVSLPADRKSITFGLRASARFSDGKPVTPEDVIFSLDEQKRAHPAIALNYKDIVKAEQTGERQVTFHFSRGGSRDLPYIASLMTVIPKHYWTGKDAKGEPRDITRTILEAPVGAGPYRVKSIEPGRSVSFERIADWWGRDLPVNVGQYNFGEIRYLSFRDDVPEFESLKSGEIDLREENSSRKWATQYDIPAVRDGRILKAPVETKTVAQVQGFVFNARRAKFADPRVRRAFALAYDFESANKSLFYGLYRRINSIFDNSELAATGAPQGRELALLETLRDKVPPEVFGPAYKSPIQANADSLRNNLREAARLLDEAGWKIDKGVRKNAKGETLEVEFLDYDQQFQRIVLPYKQNLEKIGVQLSLRVTDVARFHERTKTYDYDMITGSWPQSHAPGAEQREYWGSDAADREASRNYAGIKNPAVDALAEALIFASTKEELVATARALDRVVMWNHYFVPQWYNPTNWYAHWNKFGKPQKIASQDPSPTTTWWFDPALAARLGGPNAKK